MIHKQRVLVGFSDVQDTAEAEVVLMSCQRPVLTRSPLRKIMGGDHRETGKRRAGIWDEKVPYSQLTSRHTVVMNSLHRAFTRGLQKRVDRQTVSSLFCPLTKHNF